MLELIAQAATRHGIDMDHWSPAAVLELLKWLLTSGNTILTLYVLFRKASKGEVQAADTAIARMLPNTNTPASRQDVDKANAIATGTGDGTIKPL